MTLPTHYQLLELKLHELLAAQTTVNEADKLEVLHFIDVDEYGLALETFVGSIVENRQELTTEAESLVRELVVMMELTDSPVLHFLNQKQQS